MEKNNVDKTIVDLQKNIIDLKSIFKELEEENRAQFKTGEYEEIGKDVEL